MRLEIHLLYILSFDSAEVWVDKSSKKHGTHFMEIFLIKKYIKIVLL